MPIYEYNCPKCGVFEVTQRITENALKKCPTCKSRVERIISATSFVLKGSGWYATDYASKPKTESSNDSAPKDSAASSAAPSSTDSSGNGAAAADSSKAAAKAVTDSSKTASAKAAD